MKALSDQTKAVDLVHSDIPLHLLLLVARHYWQVVGLVFFCQENSFEPLQVLLSPSLYCDGILWLICAALFGCSFLRIAVGVHRHVVIVKLARSNRQL